MAFGVFIHRADSVYKDSPTEHYQFPKQYLGRAAPTVGDWIIYYEPVKVSQSLGYYAAAKVQKIIPDPTTEGMYLALIVPGSYIDFPKSVPFKGPDGLVERGVQNAQWAVRLLSPSDFNRIISLGFEQDDELLPRVGSPSIDNQFREEAVPFQFEQERDRVNYLSSRIVRDRAFRQIVLRAYDQRCAITGLKLINGGGRAEVEAAHIRPVEASGPDNINNGIALSGTVHWMFDRGLISLADDLKILVSRQINDPDGVRAIINRSGHAQIPQRASERPHPHFLRWHRENCFKN